ncbi:MAG: exodeoxyribonuclease VII large subunit [Clostridiales bacterium]|nr:exodeoxyribonuclease VII large subunit [Clostridiales bacterium]
MYKPDFTAPQVLSVSQLNFYIKSLVENDAKLNCVFLTGEISNLTDHYCSGHIYLSLKDDKSLIRAVMFAGNARNLRFKPADGMKIICRGRISVYEPNGQYQLYIEDMQPDGIGALTLAYEQLKNSLSEKGLFDSQHKKTLPKFPETIGVITSPTGATVQDIRNILSRRFPCADIVLCPVLVQGDSAPAQLVKAVKTLDKYNACDVIIIGRGGGSVEDLWAFNSEELAYAIYDCKIPVISAVGHETDYTICDFVSDLRAPTPSAAAELAVPDKNELMLHYKSQMQYISSMTDVKLNKAKILAADKRMRLSSVSPQVKISEFSSKITEYRQLTERLIGEKISDKDTALSKLAAKLESLNPLSVLSRGYSIAEKDGKVISSKSQLNYDDSFTLEFSDGKINAKVTGD